MLLELRWNGEASSVSPRPTGEVLDELTLTLRSPDGAELPLTLRRGTVQILARGAGLLAMDVDLTLMRRSPLSHATGQIRVSGALALALLDAADAPRWDLGLDVNAQPGVLAATRDTTTSEEQVFGPSGHIDVARFGPIGDGPPPDAFTAAPRMGPFTQLGSTRLDALRAATPEMSLDEDGALSASASSPESGAVIGPWLIWLDRAVAHHLYEVAGANPSGMDAGATILGVIASVDPATGDLSRTRGVTRVTLTDNDGVTREAVLLDEHLRRCAPSQARWFLFTEVAEATADEPHHLELIDSSGATVPAYDMLLYPAPGSALVLGLAAAEP